MKKKPTTIFYYLLLVLFFISSTPKDIAASGSEISSDNKSTCQEDERFDQTISGKVFRNTYNVPFKGVAVIFAPAGGTVVTNDTGYYSITLPRNWSGTATPVYCDDFEYYEPAQRTYTNIITNYSNQNFVHTFTQEFTISGTFTYADGTPIANRAINVGEGKNVTTNEFGEYSITKKPCWTNGLTPTLDYHFFIPDTISLVSITSNQENVDFQGVDYYKPVPPGFEFANTANPCMIAIEVAAQPNLCGAVIEAGDYIGAFYLDENGQEKCGGHGIWSNHANGFVAAMGDDTYTLAKDGFAYGETMRWKVYSYALGGIVFPATPTYRVLPNFQTNNKWYPLGMYKAKAMQGIIDNQVLIPQGWSGLSSYTVPKSSILTNVMNPILSHLVILQDMTKMYYPGAGINTMLLWTSTKGYKIKVDQDVYLLMPGCPLTNPTVNLTAGWNIVPVLSSCNVLLSEVFAPVMNKLTVVKEVAGNRVYWPAAGVQTLQVLEPGKAYFVLMTSPASITYSDCDNLKQSVVEQQHFVAAFENIPWESPLHTATTHTIALSTEAMESLPDESIIGVFTTDGICAALAGIGDKQQAVAITAFGDEPSSAEIEGLAADEELQFKLFDIKTGNIATLLVEYDEQMPSADGYFTDNGLSMLKTLKMSSTGVAGYNQQQVQIHPNPSSGLVNFRGNIADYQVQVINVQGEIKDEQTFSGNGQLDLSHLARGIYIVKIKDAETTYIRKLILK
jgi:hypothetical protein